MQPSQWQNSLVFWALFPNCIDMHTSSLPLICLILPISLSYLLFLPATLCLTWAIYLHSLISPLITPVFQKRDPTDIANYRLIAISDLIFKMYASILNRRIVDITENFQHCSGFKTAFRPKLSTLHPRLCLQHVIELSEDRGQKAVLLS